VQAPSCQIIVFEEGIHLRFIYVTAKIRAVHNLINVLCKRAEQPSARTVFLHTVTRRTFIKASALRRLAFPFDFAIQFAGKNFKIRHNVSPCCFYRNATLRVAIHAPKAQFTIANGNQFTRL
jgi:hypothetical protein